MDFEDNHKINYSEFIAATIDIKEHLTTQRINSIFHSFDIRDKGFITENDIKIAFSKFGKKISEKDIKNIMKIHDSNSDGKIYFKEFL